MLRKWKLTLETLSPVHIKGQDPKYGMGMVRVGRDGYIIDEIKLSEFLQEKSLIDAFVNYLQTEEKPSLESFLSKNRVTVDSKLLRQISSKITKVGDGTTFICDGTGNYFVPGSSIKGGIRTALLYHLLKQMKQTNRTEFNGLVIKRINNKLAEYNRTRDRQERREIRRQFAEGIEEKVFQDFLESLVRNREIEKGPHTDLLRAIKVSDSNSLGQENIQNETIKVVCLRNNHTYYFGSTRRGEISLNYDCLKEGVDFEVTLSIDIELLNKFYPSGDSPFNDLNSLIAIVREFGTDQWVEENSLFQNYQTLAGIRNFYSRSTTEPLFRIGWGTGMLGTTIALLLDSGLRERIRNEVMGHNRPGLFAPHSKRVVMRNNQPTFPLGWIKIKEWAEI